MKDFFKPFSHYDRFTQYKQKTIFLLLLFLLQKQREFFILLIINTTIKPSPSVKTEGFFNLIIYMKNIVLYGMRWCGKTTIGKALAEEVWYPFYDLDQLIGKEIGMPVFDFIQIHGWDIFRQREHENLLKILELDGDKIISLGWWAITFENNQKLLLKKSNKLIYIECPLEMIRERIEKDENTGNKRNSLTGKWLQVELMEIYEKRKWCYESHHDFKVNNNGFIEKCVYDILRKI